MAETTTKKPRPAKDLKPTDMRSKALQEAKTAKTKRLAEEMRKKAKAQAADKKVRPAKDIAKGDMRSKFLKDAKAGNIKAATSSPKSSFGSSVLRGFGRVAGPVGALVGMTTPAGEGSDKPSGPLMRGGKLPGYKYVDEKGDLPSSATKMLAPARGGGPERRQGSQAPSMRQPESKAAEFRKKNLEANRKAGVPKIAKAPAKAASDKSRFRGNWVGATPSAMQAGGGKKLTNFQRMTRRAMEK